MNRMKVNKPKMGKVAASRPFSSSAMVRCTRGGLKAETPRKANAPQNVFPPPREAKLRLVVELVQCVFDAITQSLLIKSTFVCRESLATPSGPDQNAVGAQMAE